MGQGVRTASLSVGGTWTRTRLLTPYVFPPPVGFLWLMPVQYHTGKTDKEFHTAQGQSITAGVQALSDRFNLSYQFGISPNNYFRERYGPSSKSSKEEVL